MLLKFAFKHLLDNGRYRIMWPATPRMKLINAARHSRKVGQPWRNCYHATLTSQGCLPALS